MEFVKRSLSCLFCKGPSFYKLLSSSGFPTTRVVPPARQRTPSLTTTSASFTSLQKVNAANHASGHQPFMMSRTALH